MNIELQPGDIIAEHYEVLEKRSGGMGIVYICVNRTTKEKKVFKTIKQQYLSNENAHQRFFQEALLWIELGYHYRIVSAEHASMINDQPYVICEYGGAMNLREFIYFVGPLNLHDAILIAAQILEGLDYSQRKIPSLVHTDLKPENIIIDYRPSIDLSIEESMALIEEHKNEFWAIEDDTKRLEFVASRTGKTPKYSIYSKITDFGLSRLSTDNRSQAKGTLVGTPLYMSPEQCRGDEIDLRSDIYSFGILLYEMLSGKWPYQIKNEAEIFNAHIRQKPLPIKNKKDAIPEKIIRIVMQCLEKDPANRYQDFASILGEIDALDIAKRSLPFGNSLFRGSRHGETDYLISRAITLITFGEIEDGLHIVEQAISREDSLPSELSTVAESLNLKGCFELALKYSNLVCEAFPEDTHALMHKSISLSNLGNPEEAIKCLDRIIELNPNFAPAWSNKGMVYCDYLHKPDIAVTCFEKAISIDPKLPQAWGGRGVALSFLNKSDDALISWKKCLELNPSDYETWLNIGGYFTDGLGKHQEALNIFNDVTKTNPNISRGWQFRGTALSRLNQLDDAMKSYEKGLAIDPNNDHCHQGIGDILGIFGNYTEALDHYQIVLRKRSSEVPVLINVGICEFNLGEIEKARYYFEKALQYDPTNTRLKELINYCRSS